MRGVFMDSRNMIIAYAVKYEGQWDLIYEKLCKKEFLEDEEALRYLSMVNSNVITILDNVYPDYLRQIYKPPFVLFYYGDITLIQNLENNLAVVGSREPESSSVTNLTNVLEDVAKEYVIVSGLAKGIDSLAHRIALKNKGRTIAVLGNGIDYCYPSENTPLYKDIKKNHLVISEFPHNTEPKPINFPMRNRIIVGLSRATLIGEAKFRSGSQITANLTLQSNKELMCLPSSDLENSLNNRLIQEGAALITSSDDILHILRSIFLISPH